MTGSELAQAKDSRLGQRIALIPDAFEFVDESGRNLGWPDWCPDLATKVFLAKHSLRWKQSVQITAERLIHRALREFIASRTSALSADSASPAAVPEEET